MTMKTTTTHILDAPSRFAVTQGVLLLLLASLLLISSPLSADDRDLVRTSTASPYVMVLFDNTGSMTRTTEGPSAALLDDGTDSKLFQAKEALDQVIQETHNVSFGFATFPNITRMQVLSKQCSGACIGRSGVGRQDARLNSTGWCTGWEANNDDAADIVQGYRVTWPTFSNDRDLDVGDMIPLDWEDDNSQRIRERLAPNLALGETSPDYGVARYFRDTPGLPPLPDDTGLPGGGDDCAEGDEPRFSGNNVYWDVTNLGADSRTIASVVIGFPSRNGQLYQLRVDGSPIWDGERDNSPAVINSNFHSEAGRRVFAAGQEREVEFRFEEDDDDSGDYQGISTDPDRYSITLTFTDGCTVKYPGNIETCASGAASLGIVDEYVEWFIANNSSESITINKIAIIWPEDNGQLRNVDLDGNTIYTRNEDPPSEVIDSNWYGGSWRRRIDEGDSEKLRFRFQRYAETGQGDYSIQVTFTNGCVVTYDSADPGPGGGACAQADQDLSFSDTSFTWLVNNNSSEDSILDKVLISWPAFNGNLTRIHMDDVEIWTGGEVPPLADIDLSLAGDPALRTIPAGDQAIVQFTFENLILPDAANYQMRLRFNGECSVEFMPSDPGGPGDDDFLRLADERARPFLGYGNTPLDQTLRKFGDWYSNWRPTAETYDEDLRIGCRDVYVVLLTDGAETCGGNPSAASRYLLDSLDIKTYVIGFATDTGTLDAIAENGGTEEAYSAANQGELIAALSAIFTEIEAKSRTFASVTVPSVAAASINQSHLTSFSPVADLAPWPGRVDSYTMPIPMTSGPGDTIVPDRSEKEWDAGEQLVDLAPTPTDITNDTFKVGDAADERRVYYGEPESADAVPWLKHFFLPPVSPEGELYLYGPEGMGIDPTFPGFSATGAAVVAETLVQKPATIVDPVTGSDEDITYVLGDVFHSDPLVAAAPDNFAYFSADNEGRVEPCGPRLDGEPELHPPYSCFAKEQQHRRQVLLFGSNDGQVHAVDAGQPSADADGIVTFDSGTGKELFSYIPRGVLPAVRRLAQGDVHEWAVDGPLTLGDVVIDPEHGGTPDADQRHWRTVVIGGLREGGQQYYAIDVTLPDKLDEDGVPESPSYLPSCAAGGAGCAAEAYPDDFGPFDPVPYPLILWEFGDTWDEDGNDAPDMAYTWSKPNIGRVRVLDAGGEIVEKYVAVYGGGLDPDFKREPQNGGTWNPKSGNYLYMVDVETGKIIYKRRLDVVDGLVYPAMVPSEPAAVDRDFDSYLDTIYIGTTAGHVLKVDISEAVEIELTTVDDYSTDDPITGEPPYERTVRRVIDPSWDPFPLFSTGGHPIYYPPSVVYVSEKNSYALAFGTGDREDLWDEAGQEGRLYLFLDGGFTATTPNLPFTEDKLEEVLLDSGNTTGNFLFDTGFDPGQTASENPGWFIVLEEEERLINKALSLSGVVFFSTYRPDVRAAGNDGCGRSGGTNLYVVSATNANGLLADSNNDDELDRFRTVADFLTKPFVEAGAGAGDVPEDPSNPPDPDDDPCSGMENVTEVIQENLFPSDCNFANYTLNVKAIRSGTGVECVVPLPVCIVERNWKEF